jgi:hypothetical protein
MRASIKKFVISITALTTLLTLAACGNSQNTPAEEQSKSSNSEVITEMPEEQKTINTAKSPLIDNSAEISSSLDNQMPPPFDENTDSGSDANSGFYQPCNRILDNVPTELLRLRDENEVNDWIKSFSSIANAPDSIDEYVNIYSFVTRFDITKKEAETALAYYIDSDDKMISISSEQLDIIFSGDIKAITQSFASEYSIVIGEFVYCPNWIYTHSVDDYKRLGITAEAVEVRADLYAQFYFTDEARTAFSDKLSDYTGIDVKLNSKTSFVSTKDATTIKEDSLIVDDKPYSEIEDIEE